MPFWGLPSSLVKPPAGETGGKLSAVSLSQIMKSSQPLILDARY
jgi:hypothetical protein